MKTDSLLIQKELSACLGQPRWHRDPIKSANAKLEGVSLQGLVHTGTNDGLLWRLLRSLLDRKNVGKRGHHAQVDGTKYQQDLSYFTIFR